ncbi:P-loop containing nucleoside triphosphate hydrolase protein [Mycena sp. CBHHK59/15]|nr:P-loop containing nucleoside triphosphate hydrolase protein [Mycena sp. CBHHK59/15]
MPMRLGLSDSASKMTPSYHQLSGSEYASRRKELLGLMSQLRSVGAQGELDLPRIAVIGNQSAGKSSVVEAISGIKVPRDSGTCTRCPMECRLASFPEWACRISIRREFDENGERLLFGSEPEAPFGAPIKDKNHVELALRRAQLAVLNPGIEVAEIMKMDVDQLKAKMLDDTTASFSKNVVCIELEGPDLTDLHFLDLPGLIQNATPEAVRLVEEMVVDNISGNCLILVAIPMTDDIENQKAMMLARQQDPEGVRTIGVMTKPDMLSTGSMKSRALWLDVIEGQKHQLRHGYYCTRQPDDDERAKGITTVEARKAEIDFFSRTAPWATSSQKDRFGTENLVSTLSTLLVKIIAEKLPTILQTANKHLEECRAALLQLPAPSTENPATQNQTGCSRGFEPSELIQRNNAAFGDFKIAIRRTAPNFVAVVRCNAASRGAEVLSDEEEGEILDDQTADNTLKRIYLTDVREELRKAKTRELPGDVPPAAKAALIADFQETWGHSTQICFDGVKDSLCTLLSQKIQHIFDRYSNLRNRLHTYVSDLITEHYDECTRFLLTALEMETTPYTQNTHYLLATTEKWASKYKEQRAGKNSVSSTKRRKLEKCTEPPAPTPFSFAQPNTPKAQAPFGAPFRHPFEAPAASPAPRQDDQRVENVDKALALLAQLGYTGLKEEDLGKLHAGDEYETEITLMSGVRAYFQVRRIIDNVPCLIDTKFVKALANDLQAKLIREFKLGQADAQDDYAEYLSEDASVVAKRNSLNQRRTMLEGVYRDLVNFGM